MTKKNKVLILSFGLLLLVSYQLAIKNTVSTYKEYQENKKKNELQGNIPEQMAFLTEKEKVLDNQLLELNLDDSSVQSNLLKFLNHQAQTNSVKIIAFNAPHTIVDDTEAIETFIFDLEGDFSAILKTINALENSGFFGAIIHLQIEKLQNYRSKKTFLQAKVFLEQVR